MATTQEQVGTWEASSFDEANAASGDFELIDEGTYTVELVHASEAYPVSPEFNPDGTKKQWDAVFQVVDDEDWEGYEIRGWYTLSMHEKANMYKLVKALLGDAYDPKVRPTPDMLIGKRCRAFIEHTVPKDETKHPWPKVTNPTPIKATARKSRSKPTSHDAKDVAAGSDRPDEPPF